MDFFFFFKANLFECDSFKGQKKKKRRRQIFLFLECFLLRKCSSSKL